MRTLVEVLAKALVEFPEQVDVTESTTDKTIHLRLTVAPSDMGKSLANKAKRLTLFERLPKLLL